MEWYVRQGVAERGPMTLSDLHRDFRDGSVNKDSLIRRKDSEIWARLKHTEAADELGVREQSDENILLSGANPSLVKPFGWRLGLFRFALIVFLAVQACTLLINAVVLVSIDYASGYVDQDFLDSPIGTVIFSVVGILPTSSWISLLFSAVVYGVFFQHAQFNVRQMGAPEATMKPFEAWIWHIVPIASLWKPLEAMTQIWNASHRLAAQKTASGLLAIWWATWLIALFGSRIVNAIYMNLQDPTMLPPTIVAESTVTALFMASAICLWIMSSKLSALHRTISQGGQAEVF